MSIQPYGDLVLVAKDKKPEKESTNHFGLIITDEESTSGYKKAKVLAVGSGRSTDDGNTVPMLAKVGDTILFTTYGVTEIEENGEEYYLIRDSDILAIIK